MSQTVTITPSSGNPIDVTISEDDGSPTISDAEAQAALQQAIAGGATPESLQGATLGIGDQSVDAGRLNALLAGLPAAPVAPTHEPAAPESAPEEEVAAPADDTEAETTPASPRLELPDSYMELRVSGGGGAVSLGGDAPAHLGGSTQIELGAARRLGDSHAFLTYGGGLRYSGGQADYQTPGGEDARSRSDDVGVVGHLGVRGNPRGGRFVLDAEAYLAAEGLITPENQYEDLPRIVDCPEGVGREQCEQGANPGRAITGTDGLYDSDLGASRDAEGGAAIEYGARLSAGYQIAAGDGAVTIAPYLEVGGTTLLPSEGRGWTGATVEGGLIISGQFRARRAGVERATVVASEENAGATEAAAPVRDTLEVEAGEGTTIHAPAGGWPVGARLFINGEERSDLAPSGNEDLVIPSSALHPGENTVEVRDSNNNPVYIYTLLVPEAPANVTGADPVTVGDFQFTLVNATVSPGQSALIARIVPQIALSDKTPMSITGGTPSVEVRSGEIGIPVDARTPMDVELTSNEIERMISPGATMPLPIPVTIRIGSAAFSVQITLQPATRFAADPVMEQASYNSSNRRNPEIPRVTINTIGAEQGVVVRAHAGLNASDPAQEQTVNSTAGANQIQVRHSAMPSARRRGATTSMQNNIVGVAPGSYLIEVVMPGGEVRSTTMVVTGSPVRRTPAPVEPPVRQPPTPPPPVESGR